MKKNYLGWKVASFIIGLIGVLILLHVSWKIAVGAMMLVWSSNIDVILKIYKDFSNKK